MSSFKSCRAIEGEGVVRGAELNPRLYANVLKDVDGAAEEVVPDEDLILNPTSLNASHKCIM